MIVNRRNKKFYYVIPGAIVISCVWLMATGLAEAFLHEKPSEISGKVGPVVLELFTSQGCSSCPPADNLLRELAGSPEWSDKIIPLSFHVDYWNYLGWKDPFSKKEWTERQGDYVQKRGGATMYTPQIVIQGRTEMVGSKQQQVKRAISEQMQNPEGHLFSLSIDQLEQEGNIIKGQVSVFGASHKIEGPLVLVGVAFQKGLSTNIRKGENAGKTLRNDFVVRNLKILSQLQHTSDLKESIHFEINLDGQASSEQLGVAVFVQATNTMAIYGASVGY